MRRRYLYRLALAVNRVGDWARSAKFDADDTEDDMEALPALNGAEAMLPGVVGIDCPPLYNSTPGEAERCMIQPIQNTY